MTEQIATHHSTTVPVDVEERIRHLNCVIRRRERMLTWGGFAQPHVPENPAVSAERTARLLAGIADLRAQLADWEAQAATTPAAAH